MRRWKHVALALALVAGAGACHGASSLVERSPFVPRGYNEEPEQPEEPAQPPPTPSVLEFSGFAKMDGEWKFTLLDKRSGQVHWVAIGEQSDNLQVLAFDERNFMVTVRNSGRTERLKLREASGTPLPIQRPQTGGGGSSTRANVNPGRTSGSENQRRIPRRRVIVPRSSN